MSAESLRGALHRAGLDCEVEAHGKLAVLRADDATLDALADDEFRARATGLATEHGFTHAAIELAD